MELFFLFIISYMAGILSFLAPCTLPIIPVYLSMCASNNFRSLTLHTFYLGLGVSIIYIVLGVFAGTLGSLMAGNKIFLMKLIGILLVIFGISIFFGFSLNHHFPKQKNFGVLSTIMYGLVFGLAWSGCIGPVLGGVLVLAGSTGTALKGGLLLFVYALGMMTPLIAFSVVADRTNKIPDLWHFLYGRIFTLKIGSKKFILHTTNIITGLMFIFLGLFFFMNGTAWLAKTFPAPIEWIFNLEEKIQIILNK